MKPPVLEHRRVETLEEALALLAELGDDAKILAGGQSLISLLNFRLARPAVLVDIGALSDLVGISKLPGGGLQVGAMTTHRAIERAGTLLQSNQFKVLSATANLIGHLPIRTRGTFGGSVAHGDPVAEWPLLCTALEASVVVQSTRGTRRIEIDDLYTGFLTTALEPDEMIIAIDLPGQWRCSALHEFARRRGDFAIVAVAVAADVDKLNRCSGARVVIGGVDSVPVRAREAERELIGRSFDAAAAESAAHQAAVHVNPHSDMYGSSKYRRRLVRALARRAIEDARGSAR